jgi:hypothetical protein
VGTRDVSFVEETGWLWALLRSVQGRREPCLRCSRTRRTTAPSFVKETTTNIRRLRSQPAQVVQEANQGGRLNSRLCYAMLCYAVDGTATAAHKSLKASAQTPTLSGSGYNCFSRNEPCGTTIHRDTILDQKRQPNNLGSNDPLPRNRGYHRALRTIQWNEQRMGRTLRT